MSNYHRIRCDTCGEQCPSETLNWGGKGCADPVCWSLPCRAPELAAFPEKVLRAKLKAMRRRGIVDGCACGCRGDWLLVRSPAGKAIEAGPWRA